MQVQFRLFQIISLSALIFASACRENPRGERIENKTVILNAGESVRTLDPGLATDTVSARCIRSIMRGLTMLDSDGKIFPDMAESFTMLENGLVWEFKIRKTQWTNGQPVTAEDFEYAWVERMLNPEFQAEYAYMLFYVKGGEQFYNGDIERDELGVTVVAPDTLRVELVAPMPFFPQIVTHHSYYPVCKSVVSQNPKWAMSAESYVGNGPFELVEHEQASRFITKRHDGYWDSSNVYMNAVNFRFIAEESTERIALENGEIDGTNEAPRVDLDQLKASGNLKIVPQFGTYYLNFNMKRDLFKDVRVRRALTLAVDRKAIVENVSRAGEQVTTGLVPPTLFDNPPEPYFKDAQFEEAKRLMAEAGYPNGQGFPPIKYIYNNLEKHRLIAQVLQQDWKKHLGIDLEIQNMEFKVLIENRRAGNFDMARNAWIADFADPINFLDIYISQSDNNDSHFEDPKYDALVEKARLEPDLDKRMEYLLEAEAYLMEQLPVLPIYNYTLPYLSARELQGYDISPLHTLDVTKLRWAPSVD